jgi:hypothetical protein
MKVHPENNEHIGRIICFQASDYIAGDTSRKKPPGMWNNAAHPFSDRKIHLFTLVKKSGDFFFAFSGTSRVPTAREGALEERFT